MKKKLLSLLLIGLGISCTTYIPSEIIQALPKNQNEEENLPDTDNSEPEDTNIPARITKTIPPNGEIHTGEIAYLEWEFMDEDGPVEPAKLLESLEFEIEYDTVQFFSNPVKIPLKIINEEQKDNKVGKWISVIRNKNYFWRVHVYDGKDDSFDSIPFNFSVISF